MVETETDRPQLLTRRDAAKRSPRMTEPTPIESYRDAQRSGLIGQRQMQVLEFVLANQPYRQGDVGRHLADTSSYNSWTAIAC